MDAAQWPQEMVHASMEDMVSSSTRLPQAMERRVRPQKDQAINCPRCNSTNTKFCYYNNYSPTQPRYFCKTCRRYWTEGGTLRNVPVGGGSRKNKRSSPSSSSTNPKKLVNDTIPTPNPRSLHQSHDLNMVFPSFQPKLSGDYTTSDHVLNMNITNTTTTTTTSTTDALRSGLMNPFAPMPMVQESGGVFQSGGFGLQDFRSNLSYHHPVDGSVGGSGGEQELKESNGGRLLFPFEDLRQNGSDHFDNQSRAQGGDSSVFWNEVMGGGTTNW